MADLRWSLTAENDLRALEELLASSPKAAAAVGDRLIKSVENIRTMPDLGHVVPELGDEHLREVVFPGYRIVYFVDGANVTILRVVHTIRDLR